VCPHALVFTSAALAPSYWLMHAYWRQGPDARCLDRAAFILARPVGACPIPDAPLSSCAGQGHMHPWGWLGLSLPTLAAGSPPPNALFALACCLSPSSIPPGLAGRHMLTRASCNSYHHHDTRLGGAIARQKRAPSPTWLRIPLCWYVSWALYPSPAAQPKRKRFAQRRGAGLDVAATRRNASCDP
jgi:hypothetical protein